jgi:hypothetical protein
VSDPVQSSTRRKLLGCLCRSELWRYGPGGNTVS